VVRSLYRRQALWLALLGVTAQRANCLVTPGGVGPHHRVIGIVVEIIESLVIRIGFDRNEQLEGCMDVLLGNASGLARRSIVGFGHGHLLLGYIPGPGVPRRAPDAACSRPCWASMNCARSSIG